MRSQFDTQGHRKYPKCGGIDRICEVTDDRMVATYKAPSVHLSRLKMKRKR